MDMEQPFQIRSPHLDAAKEPFLRLRKHRNIILTPPRDNDAPSFVKYFNDSRVYPWMDSTPFPYLLEQAEGLMKRVKPRFDAALKELEDSVGIRDIQNYEPLPSRFHTGELMNTNAVDWDRKAQNEAENNSREAGDPDVLWSIGDFLAPSHHGQGIMSDVLDTLLHDWAIPRMGVRRILLGVVEGNMSSVRVFEKNGFHLKQMVKDYRKIRGETKNLQVMEWKLGQEDRLA
ncbi:hypothetical protein BDZ97DRAFT_1751858 [Flammula alnicola]|nr:hypothetical protein BDZ97DRAFT_1751858 [Flammula alnicola]